MAYPGGNGWPERPQQPDQRQPPPPGYPPQYAQDPQQQYQGHQQFPQQTYQGFSPAPPKKGKKGLWIGLGALVVVIAVGATLFFVLRDGDDPRPEPTPPPAAASASKPPSTAQSGDAPEDNKVPAKTLGWQGIVSRQDKTAYDLPPTGWETKPGYTTGNTGRDLKMVIHDAMRYRLGACPDISGSNRGTVGFATADQIPVDNAARGAVRLWIQSATGKTDVPLPEVKQIPIAGGTMQALSSSASYIPSEGEGCRAPSVKVTSAAFKVGEQTICFVMILDQGTPDALSEADAQMILASLRPQP
ncbi:hypothetical protein [Amycolatopsis regifaucium]|uniref:DUF8017 domain-containing protein n=1 Tax=Amycolatopsis regifaucium TaxID=546365 RepID=A0A154M6X4_9PSEU|nr:hypothetical protein [Amycolatopsis regifaucium]KZB80404.1 hypothetical protein AVL48_12970 [Amycolatopsis regifaucium]OKA05374.1 hypothetical protein ATP06_0226795 [Amycolatopsis regifaucium]SFJ08177.1 hypothetical protein SAMN04489731_115130 [Amycolatopsis regifaucium]